MCTDLFSQEKSFLFAKYNFTMPRNFFQLEIPPIGHQIKNRIDAREKKTEKQLMTVTSGKP